MSKSNYLKMISVLLVVLFLVFSPLNARESDRFTEELYIKPLPSGHVYTYFQFTTTVDKSLEIRDQWRHSHLFPSSLGETLSSNHVEELHLSLSQGLWRYSSWGYPTRPSPPGAQLWVWFQEKTPNVESSWKDLVNSLSGQFCTSMNFGDGGNTVQPTLSFPPEGAVKPSASTNSSLLRYASLPKESVCTENLTPLKKLLPCDTKAGLAQLLNSLSVLGSKYFALAVDVRSVCKTPSCEKTYVEIRESVSVVFDPTINQNGKQDWSLSKLFGISVNHACPVAHSSKIYVDISSNSTDYPFVLSPPVSLSLVTDGSRTLAVYDVAVELQTSSVLNIKSLYKKNHIHWIRTAHSVNVERYVTGYGLEWGGIQCDIQNNLYSDLKVIYLDVLPWFLRVYAHTLKLSINGVEQKPELLKFIPGQDRKRPHQLELLLDLPARSRAQVSFQFQRAFLKWTEYPPDANHGFYVPSAIFTTLLSSQEPNGTFLSRGTSLLSDSFLRKEAEDVITRVYTGSLLVTLPTPDFSMPYNCICLTCTVVALAFGPIHNITTKRLSRMKESEEKKSWLDKVKSIFKKSSDSEASKKND